VVICKDTGHYEFVQKGTSKASDIDGSIVLTYQLAIFINANKPKFEPKIIQGFFRSPKLASMKQGSKKKKVMLKQVQERVLKKGKK
jgi:hypothetical protein